MSSAMSTISTGRESHGRNSREFLSADGASGAATLTVETNPTAIVPLGRSLSACRVSCGTATHGGPGRQTNQTRLGTEKFEALLNYAYDRGIRQFDTADMYGTHPYLGRVLKDKPREDIQIVTKIWSHKGWLQEDERPLADVLVRRFLDELQTDYLDLVQLHGLTRPDWNIKLRDQMDALAKLKEEGLIRAHGVSIHSTPAMVTASEEPWVDVVHTRVNQYGQQTDGPMEETVPLLKKIHDSGKGIIGMKLIGEGTFDLEQREKTLDFVMGLGCVDCMTVGFEAPEQIDEFLDCVQRRLEAEV